MESAVENASRWARSVKKCVYADYVHTDRLGSVVKPGGRWGWLAAMNPVQEYPWRHILYKKRKKDLIMSLPIDGWKNKRGTSIRSCKCGSWKQHWINGSKKAWPKYCCVAGCTGTAEVGAHVYNTSSDVHGEYIVPACKGCNALTDEFSLKGGITLVPANKQKTCEQ